MMLSLTAFSQPGKNKQVKCIHVPVVKQIMKDLLIGDEAKSQLKLSDSLLVLTEQKVQIQDSIIGNMKHKEDNYLKEIDIQNQKYVISENYSKQLEKDLKKLKVKNKFTTIISGVVVATLTFILITH
jgi:hypothetical protein